MSLLRVRLPRRVALREFVAEFLREGVRRSDCTLVEHRASVHQAVQQHDEIAVLEELEGSVVRHLEVQPQQVPHAIQVSSIGENPDDLAPQRVAGIERAGRKFGHTGQDVGLVGDQSVQQDSEFVGREMFEAVRHQATVQAPKIAVSNYSWWELVDGKMTLVEKWTKVHGKIVD